MRARGCTLVELLVALAVLSTGLLGAAMVLLAGLRAQAAAQRESAATAVLRDLADRIRAQPSGLLDMDRAWFAQAAQDIAPGSGADILVEPAIGPAAPDRYVLSLRLAHPRDGEAQVFSLVVLVRAPVAG